MNLIQLFDVIEALEQYQEFKPIYYAVLKHTGSREEALKAVSWLIKQEENDSQASALSVRD